MEDDFDVTKTYFLMSFRFDKRTPEDFGLVPSGNADTCVLNDDQSLWVKQKLYDFGWGNENGFLRLPKLDFDALWTLLTESNVRENRYGAAHVLLQEFPEQLLERLMEILHDPTSQGETAFKEAANILQLDKVRNRSSIVGKSADEINRDFEHWKWVSQKVCDMMGKV